MPSTYTKQPLSLAGQVQRLQQRGMHIADPAAAEKALGRLNYYRLTAYWFPHYSTPQRNHFKPGTDFCDVLALYEFDRRLRLRLIDAIERFEIALRTQFAHQLAMRHGAWSYEDPAYFKRPQWHTKCLASLDGELKRSHETFIKHYNRQYGDPPRPPIWMTCEVMSLGLLSNMLDNLKHRQDRRAIAQAFGLDEVVLCSLAHHVTYIRNACAHHARLWNRHAVIKPKIPNRAHQDLLDTLVIPAAGQPQPQTIYNSLVLLGWCLRQISDDQRWRQQIVDLMAEYPNVDQAAMGFPADWLVRPLWNSAT